MIKFSIIMPVYNASSKLKKSIESIINQKNSNWELIIVDDGSTDNSYEIANEYRKKYKNIKIIKQDNCGPGIARNRGIEESTGDYIAFIDSDDYYDSYFLTEIEKSIKENNLDLVYINIVEETENGIVYKSVDISKYQNESKENLLKLQVSGTMPWGPCMKVIKKELLKKSCFLNLEVGEELILSFDVLYKSKKLGFISKELYHYVHNNDGQHKKGGLDPWWGVTRCMKNHLIDLNLFNTYEEYISCLAARSFIISAYRCSCNGNVIKAMQNIKQQLKKYQSDYSFKNLNKKYIDKKTRIVLLLARIHFYLVIVLISKIKNKFSSKGW